MTLRYNAGFTLIEVMIVVVIVGILAAIAFPSYARYVEQARRADGKSAIMDAAQRLERCYTQENSYEDCLAFPFNSPDGFYVINVPTAPTATAFTLTATPQGAQSGDTRCGTYTLQSNGARTVSGTLTADRCW